VTLIGSFWFTGTLHNGLSAVKKEMFDRATGKYEAEPANLLYQRDWNFPLQDDPKDLGKGGRFLPGPTGEVAGGSDGWEDTGGVDVQRGGVEL
jgi:hypothetical protein